MKNQNFWKELNKPARSANGIAIAGGPFFCLAPMSDVTDIAFRQILAKYSKNRENKNKVVFWTEFVAADGLANKFARKKLSHILEYKEAERPIVAQVFGANPQNMKIACQYIASLGFDGIDINMGCPDKSVIAQGAGSALIQNPKLAREIINAAREGIKATGLNIPVSVKTRIGFNREEIDIWIPEILKEDISALTIHLRTKKEMSDFPAHWDDIKKIKKLIEKSGKDILLIGNGDIQSLTEAKEKAEKYGCDGVMIGRGVFGNPFFFIEKKCPELVERHIPLDYARGKIDKTSILEKLNILVEHTKIFDKELLQPKHKHFDVMKKHFKSYVNDFPGAKELRIKLMETKNSKEVEKIIQAFLKNI